ncbi:MAG: hypothetical protein D6702_03325, partial [Planctomycetota bacterium]
MRLRWILLERLPGLPRDWRVEGFGPGLTVLVGPNGVGKSSLARAASFFLWPETAPAEVEAAGGWETSGGGILRAELRRRAVAWSGGEPPVLPEARLAPCYRFGVADLIRDAGPTDGEIAREIRVRLAGGIDFPAVTAPFRLSARFGSREVRRLAEARRTHARILQEFRQLAAREDRLAGARRELEEARRAKRELELLARARALAEARAAEQEAAAELASFPDGMDLLVGDEAERLAELRRRRQEVLRAHEEADRRGSRARDRRNATGLSSPLDEGALARLRRRADEAADLERRLAEARRERQQADDAFGRALDRLVSDPERADLSWLTPEAMAELEKVVGRLEERRARRAAVARELENLGGDDEIPPAEPLRRAASELRRWLSLPEPDPSARPPRSWLGAGIALILAGAAAGLLVHPAAWAAAGAGAVLLVGAFRRAARARREDPARGRLGRDYAAAPLPQPEEWSRPQVEKLLTEIEDRLAGILARQQLEERRRGLRRDLEAIEQEVREAEEERAKWCDRLGLSEDAVAGGLIDLQHRLVAYRQAEERLEAAKSEVRELEKEREKLLRSAGAWLHEVGETAAEDAAGLEAAHESLARRNQEFAAACAEENEARSALAAALDRIRELDREIERLFDRAGLEPEEEPELVRRLERLEDWRRARRIAEERASVVRARTDDLADRPDLADLEPAGIEQRSAELRARAERLVELQAEVAGIEHDLDRERRGCRLEEAGAEVEAARAAALAAFEQALLAEAGRFLLEEVEAEFEQSGVPSVLRRAREWFGRFTDQRWELRLQRGEGAAFVAWDREGEREHGLAELSDGTRMQLLLAARTAFALEHEAGEPLPFFLDEALSTTDPQRFRRVAEALLELAAAGRQVVYLTAQPADLEAWRQVCAERGAEPPAVIDLGAARGLAVAAPAAALALPPAPEIPAPDGRGAAEYGAALGVPAPDLSGPVGALDLFHLLRDRLDLVHRLAVAGIRTLGQWRALPGGGTGGGLLEPDEASSLAARAAVAEAVAEAWRIGRGRPVDRAALAASRACGSFVD